MLDFMPESVQYFSYLGPESNRNEWVQLNDSIAEISFA